jgi:hypothetical protein
VRPEGLGQFKKNSPHHYFLLKKNVETLIDASKEVGLEVNVEKTKYMLLFRHQAAGQIHDIKIANRSYTVKVLNYILCL